jgi:hypothetical protein
MNKENNKHSESIAIRLISDEDKSQAYTNNAN